MPDPTEFVEILFLTVPPPRSGHVVELLATIPTVMRSEAVFSGVDVVAVCTGSKSELDDAHADLLSRGAPITHIERFSVHTVLPGLSSKSRLSYLRASCQAFIRCATHEEYSVDFAASILAHLGGVRRLYVNADARELVLDVVAKDKSAFDDTVMSAIQGQWSVVKSTRTLMTISDIFWHRSGPPTSRGSLFVSLASDDLALGHALVKRLHSDTGLDCWMYSDIVLGTKSWTAEVDNAIASADLHLFVLSEAALRSPECQREFGKVDAVAEPADVCCFLLPGCHVASLPVRYQERQCLKAEDVFAYPRLVDWINARLSA